MRPGNHTRTKSLQVNSIRNHTIVGRKSLRDELLSSCGNSNATIQSSKVGTKQTRCRDIGQVGCRGQARRRTSMKGSDSECTGAMQHGKRESWNQRLMYMEHIEA